MSERDELMFRIVSWERPKPGHMATASVAWCMGCRKPLSGSGGGGDFLCMACHDQIRAGALRKAAPQEGKQRFIMGGMPDEDHRAAPQGEKE